SKKLSLRTESSYRFERGADIEICDWASQRASQLILELAGGKQAEGVVDAYPKRFEPRQIGLRPQKVNELLGLGLQPGEIEYYLGQLGLATASRKARPLASEQSSPSATSFLVPSYRVDLKREVDLIEEVARLHGVEKIPSTAPRGAIGSNPHDAIHD